jgi:hypothetical protein
MAKPQYSGPWQRLRKQILERDQYLCQIQAPRCTTHATHVDHITPVTDGGAWWDTNNLRAACKNCNLGRNTQSPDDRWRKAKTHITLVMGPPGINKQHHIDTKPGDLIIDYDELAAALNIQGDTQHKNIVMAARKAVLRELRHGRVNTARAFIISSNPKAAEFFPYHTLKIVDPGYDATMHAITQHRNQPGLRQAAIDWYRTYGAEPPRSTSTSRDW